MPPPPTHNLAQVGENSVSKHLSTLKHLAGSRTVTVEAKHLDPTTKSDHRNVLLLSNYSSQCWFP